MVDIPASWPAKWDLADEPPSDSVDLKEMLEDAKEEREKLPFKLASEFKISIADDLVKGILYTQGLVMAAGQSQSGKTYAMCELTACLATAHPFFGNIVRRKIGVIYIAAEDSDLVENRLSVALNEHGIAFSDAPIVLIQDVPDLSDDKARAEFCEKVKSASDFLVASYGVSEVVGIIDTLAQAWAMNDENSNAEASRIIKQAGEVMACIRGPLILVHHLGKDPSKGERGASAFRGNVRSTWHVTAEVDEETKEVKSRSLLLPKIKTGPSRGIGHFRLKRVLIGQNPYGEDTFECVIETFEYQVSRQGENKSENKKRTSLAAEEMSLLRIIEAAVIEAGKPVRGDPNVPHDTPSVSRDMLKKYAETKGWIGDRENARQFLNTYINRLNGKSKIGMSREFVWLL
jgi:hypothetical protein